MLVMVLLLVCYLICLKEVPSVTTSPRNHTYPSKFRETRVDFKCIACTYIFYIWDFFSSLSPLLWYCDVLSCKNHMCVPTIWKSDFLKRKDWSSTVIIPVLTQLRHRQRTCLQNVQPVPNISKEYQHGTSTLVTDMVPLPSFFSFWKRNRDGNKQCCW